MRLNYFIKRLEFKFWIYRIGSNLVSENTDLIGLESNFVVCIRIGKLKSKSCSDWCHVDALTSSTCPDIGSLLDPYNVISLSGQDHFHLCFKGMSKLILLDKKEQSIVWNCTYKWKPSTCHGRGDKKRWLEINMLSTKKFTLSSRHD